MILTIQEQKKIIKIIKEHMIETDGYTGIPEKDINITKDKILKDILNRYLNKIKNTKLHK